MTGYKTTKARGYGAAHKRLRGRVAKTVEAGATVCWRCRRPVAPGSAWHLGHSDDRRYYYRGPEHAACSYASGGRAQRNGASAAGDEYAPPERFSRAW
jgi:hypothetical protein